MKKIISFMLSAILICNIFTLTFAEETVDNTGAIKLAQKINYLFPNSCTLDGNVITINENLRKLPETLLVEPGGEVVLDLDGNRISADDGITAIKVCGGAKLTIKGDGRIKGGDGLTYSGHAIENYGNLIAQSTAFYEGSSDYEGIFDEEYTETALYNNGIATVSDCMIDSIYNLGNITIDNECSIEYIENTDDSEVIINSVYMSATDGRSAIVNNGKMTINDGYISGGYAENENADGAHAIVNTRNLTINGGQIYGGEPYDMTGKAGAGIYVGLASSVDIKGGTIEGGGYCENPAPGIISDGNVMIYEGLIVGGLANDWETHAKAISGNYYIGSVTVASGSNNDYDYTVVEGESEYRYLKFEEITTAIRLANIINYHQPDSCYFEGDTVYLKTDVILPMPVNITGAEPCTLDLCGFTITGSGENIGPVIAVDRNVDVTICNGSIICESPTRTNVVVYNYGKLKLNSCTIENNALEYEYQGANTVTNHSTGELELNNCYVFGGDGKRIGGSAVANNGGVVTINGGNYYSGNAVAEDGFLCNNSIYNHNNEGTVLIKNGKFVGGTYRDVFCPAITTEFDVPEGTYLQESVDDITYTKVTDVNEKQYLQIIEPSSATKLAKIIEEYSPKSCTVKYGDTIEIIKPVVIDDVIAIPAGDEVTLNIENFSCAGIIVPQNAYLTLIGDGEITGKNDTIINNGTLCLKGATIVGGNGSFGVVNNGNLELLFGKIVGGVNGDSRYAAISGVITDGLCITESNDGVNYTLITGPETDKAYIWADSGTNAEELCVQINLQQADSCYCFKSEDFEEEKVVFIANCDVVNIDGENAIVDFNGHTFDEINVSGRDVIFTGECTVNNFIENHDNLIIDSFAEINGVIKNHRSVITEGNINGGIYNVHNAEVIVDGGTVTGSDKNFGNAICNENFESRIIINKGIVKGAHNVENSSAINLVLREGDFNGQVQMYGGAVIGGTGNAISADIISRPGGGSGGGGGFAPVTFAETDSVYVYMNGGVLVGGEGKSALSGCIEVENGIALKESDDGVNYTAINSNKTNARYVKAENSDYIGVTSIQFNSNYYSMEVGDKLNLNVSLLPENATNKEIIWTSSDESVVTVKNGYIYGNKFGRVSIIATTVDGLKQASCIVDIVKVSHGGGGNLGGDSSVYYNTFTNNIEYDGATAEFDLHLQTNDEIKGIIYIGIYENDELVYCQSFDAQEKHISVPCTENQYIRLYWWDNNYCPLGMGGYISFKGVIYE